MPSSQERVMLALQHQEPDRVPLDLGGSYATGMHVDTLYRLRQALRLDPPGTPVTVGDPLQMLGLIEPDLQDVLGADVIRLGGRSTAFGFPKDNWKPCIWSSASCAPRACLVQPACHRYVQSSRAAPYMARMLSIGTSGSSEWLQLHT